jgi:hypothetical protein
MACSGRPVGRGQPLPPIAREEAVWVGPWLTSRSWRVLFLAFDVVLLAVRTLAWRTAKR